jgi:hypothetical protein
MSMKLQWEYYEINPEREIYAGNLNVFPGCSLFRFRAVTFFVQRCKDLEFSMFCPDEREILATAFWTLKPRRGSISELASHER